MAKRKKRNRRRNREKVEERLPLFHSLKPETRRGVAVVVVAAVGLLLVLALQGQAGQAGAAIARVTETLFGGASFLFPIGFFIVAAILLRFIHQSAYASAMIGTLILVLAIVGLLELLFPEIRAGGVLGIVVSSPVLLLVGFWASLVILVAALIVGLLVAFNIPLRRTRRKEEGTAVESAAVPLPPREQAALQASSSRSGLRLAWQGLFGVSPDAPSAGAFTAHPVGSSDARGDGMNDHPPDAAEERRAPLPQLSHTRDSFPVVVPRASSAYRPPPLDLLERSSAKPSTGDIKANATIIRRTLQQFGIEVEMGEVFVGPTVTQYTLRPATGVKLSKILSLHKDLSLALAAHPIRIEAPIPGRSLVGIEVPNMTVATVRLRSLLEDPSYEAARKRYSLPLALGRDVAGNPVWADLARMPHLLVAGATGSGKSVSINSILVILLYQFAPEQLRLILVDPKRVELPLYNGIPHLLSPVIVDSEKVTNALRWTISEMEERYEMLAEIGARDIQSYNSQIDRRSRTPLPFIVIVVDELADIMARFGREVEGAIVRLAQMSRAVGIHLIVSTQRPSVEVITGLIKANITSRIAFQVASQVDSRTILDQAGSEKLLGNGDMLFLSGDASHARRLQGSFVSEGEVKRVVRAVKVQSPDDIAYDDAVTEPTSAEEGFGISNLHDDRYEDAKALVMETRQASASFLQRRLQVGYARAARLMDILEQRGVIGPQNGSKPREVLVGRDEDEFDALTEDAGTADDEMLQPPV